MSLAEVLASKSVDKGLDDIFKSSAGPSIVVSEPTQTTSTVQKRRTSSPNEEKSTKKRRVSDDHKAGTRGEPRGKGKEKEVESDNEESDEDVDELGQLSSEAEDSVDAIPQHESVKKSKKKGTRKTKYTPEGETKEQRDARTIFIGNLPVAVVKSKHLNKQLKRHILSFVPAARIESIRFRSVAFRNPTSTIEEDSEESKPSRQEREQKRTAVWRARQGQDRSSKVDKEEEEVKKGEKTYMSPAEKRRLAAIKGEIHEHSSATTNAYAVFAHPLPVAESALKNDVMDPFEAAQEAVRKVNGTTFADHVLRVDLAGKPAGIVRDLSAAGTLTDPRLSIFVGNLDFASSEDDVRAFFEKVMREERGDPPAGGDKDREGGNNDENNDTPRRPSWVSRVRIVRDRETQLGKGFAYVQFVDRDCVDEILALESEKLKFAKRTLRVQRCKTLPSTTPKHPTNQPELVKKPHSTPTKTRPRIDAKSQPKGDPALGKRLAGLSKEERKQAKATDPARVARRLAKKKARMAMDKPEKSGMRVRERKDKKAKSLLNTGKKDKKQRERSERNLQKKNVKK